MSPPFGPLARGKGGCRGGPRAFAVQILRAPLTLNNIVALAITHSAHRTRQAAIRASGASAGALEPGCDYLRTDATFGILAMLFAVSLVHNLFTVLRFHRIRRQVFGESMCTSRRRWRQRRTAGMDESEQAEWKLKFKEVINRLPSLFISVSDIIIALNFLGLYILTTLLAKKEEKIELGVAYASIGALVAL
jgi:hypothetical protein